jgi:hypothetical protein
MSNPTFGRGSSGGFGRPDEPLHAAAKTASTTTKERSKRRAVSDAILVIIGTSEDVTGANRGRVATGSRGLGKQYVPVAAGSKTAGR